MPTKKYLQDRVDQLKKELERVTRERDAERAEPASVGASNSVEPGLLTETGARGLMERAEAAEAQRLKLVADLTAATARLRSVEDELRAVTASEAQLLAEMEDWRTRLEAAEAENRRWLERERRWTKLEERLQREADRLAEELDALRSRSDGGGPTREEAAVQTEEGTDDRPPVTDGESRTDLEPSTATSEATSVSAIEKEDGSGAPPLRAAIQGQQIPPISRYSGANVGDEDETIEDWLDQFDLIASVFEWDERARLMHLVTHLKGSALSFYRSCSQTQRHSYTLLTEALKERFTPVHVQSVQSALFHGRVQKPQETVESYGQELKRLFQRAYPKMAREETKEGKDVLSSRFVAGLRQELQEKLTGAVGDFDVLMQRARFEEAKRKELRGEKKDPDGTRQQGRTAKETPKSTKDGPSGDGNRRSYPRARNQDNRTCHRCGADDHLVRSCPLRGRQGSSESTRTSVSTKVLSVGQADEQALEITMKTLDAKEREQPKIGHQITVEVEVEGLPVTAVVDTGSPVSIISSLCLSNVHRRLVGPKGDWRESVRKSERPPAIAVRGYGDTPIKIDAEVDLRVRRGDFEVPAVLLRQEGAPQDLLIGTDLQDALGIKFCLEEGSHLVPAPCGDRRPAPCCDRSSVRLLKATRIPARHVGIVPVVVSNCACVQGECVFEPEQEGSRELGVEWTPVLLNVSEHVGVEVWNGSYSPVTLPTGMVVGHLEPIDEECIIGKLDTVQQDSDLAQHSGCEGDGVEHIKLSGSVTESRSRGAQLCEALRLSEVPVDLEGRDVIARLVLEFGDVFALTDSELGVTDRAHHYLDVGDSTPIKQYARRIPYVLRASVEEAVDDMLQRKIIRPSTSPWASPIVLVKKRGGAYRFCVDYRKLNAITKTDVYPLPRIEDYLDALSGACFFSTLDLAAGFWQVPMHPDSIEKTAFVSHAGSYEFTVMPFGLKNAPSTFQRLMSSVLAGLSQDVCMSYIDDILVVGRTFDEHVENLRIVLQRFREAGLKLKTTKCDLLKSKVRYLGFFVSSDGVEVDPEKTRAVSEFPIPRNVRDLRGFLGLTSYYRRFIDGYSKLAKPLHRLTGKDVSYQWDSECQRAFEDLKKKLITAPVLVYPNFEVPFILETDASHDGLGAVLAQRQPDGTTRPIAYASRTIQGSESRYASSELEALGVVWATRHFHHYLYGHGCIVYTDNIALKSLLATPHPSGKLARWGLALQELDLTIQHRSGRENRNADALSRYPVEDQVESAAKVGCALVGQHQGRPTKPEATVKPNSGCGRGGSTPYNVCLHDDNCDCVNINALLTCENSSLTGCFESSTQSSALREEQLQDPDLKIYLDYLDQGLVPQDQKVARRLAAERLCYETVDGVLFRVENEGTLKLIPPANRRKQLIADLHGGVTGAHLGAEKTLTVKNGVLTEHR